MRNSKTLISPSMILTLILPMLSGFANSTPGNMSPAIEELPVEMNHENVSTESEKSPHPNSWRTKLYPSSDITRKNHLNFSGINSFVHQANSSTYITASLSRISLLSTKEPWMWTQSQTGNTCEDINTANSSVLQRVKGIGHAKAQAIIDYRNQHGPFRSLDELTNVRGIGPATVENFRMAGFCVQGSTSTTEAESNQSSSEENNSDTTVNNCNNVNTASATELQRVSRIGAVRAQAIIDYRNQHGPFQSLNELTRVRGIGAATIENFRRAGFCVKASTETSNNPPQASPNHPTTTNSNCDNVNTANAVTLRRVNRIGVVKAQAIIDYRNQHGPFRSLDELTRVRGIGPATLENFRRAGFCVSTSTSAGGSADSQSNNAQLDDLDPTDNICEDINTASIATFQRVRGIGPVKAQAITDYRNQHGPFRSLDELTRVRGIGPVTLENFRRAGFCTTTSTSIDSADLFSNHLNMPSPRTAPLTYHRSLYGGWLDTDNDCQDTRQEILIAESRVETSLDETGCIVIAGEWYDPYLDSLITDPSVIDIDHFIPLAEVHRSGGAKWDDSTRYSFGNDLSKNGVLIPVSASANRSKGDRDPANWLPPNTAYHCQYIARWVALKETWRLTMDYVEHQAVMDMQDDCGSNV